MSKICFLAQFPPPIHGLSKAVETLYNSTALKNEFETDAINLTCNKKFIKNVFRLIRDKSDLYYFTISQTRGGNIRDLLILWIIRMKRKKCVVHLHGGYYRVLVDNVLGPVQRKANYKAISIIDLAIVLGQSFKHIFEGMLPDEKIVAVPNCADDEVVISNEEFARKIKEGKTRSIKRILYLSNMIETKGYRAALQLAKAEKQWVEEGKSPRFHFEFAGAFFDSQEQRYFEQYIAENSLDSVLTYYGVVSGKDKRNLLKQADWLVLPTRYPREGQPICILEGMANGLAIISTDYAGIPDLVKDGENGILIQDSDCLPKLEEIYAANLADMQEQNREIALCEYTQEKYISRMIDSFRKVLT